jgi:hypothetical protein
VWVRSRCSGIGGGFMARPGRSDLSGRAGFYYSGGETSSGRVPHLWAGKESMVVPSIPMT